jgi:intein/homing endonuclease
MNYKKLVLTLMLGLSLLFNSGCPAFLIAAGGAGGIGTYAYIVGELKSTEKVSLNTAWDATQKAMNDLEFTTTSKEKDAFDGQLIAKGAANKTIKVKLNRQSDTLTEIRIRVGTFGDTSLSLQILESIKKQF